MEGNFGSGNRAVSAERAAAAAGAVMVGTLFFSGFNIEALVQSRAMGAVRVRMFVIMTVGAVRMFVAVRAVRVLMAVVWVRFSRKRVADREERVAAFRRANVVIDTVSARTSVVVAVPRSDPTRFALQSRNQLTTVGLVDIGQTASQPLAVFTGLLMAHGFLSDVELGLRQSRTRDKSKESADNGEFNRHLFTAAYGGLGPLIGAEHLFVYIITQIGK